MPALRPIDDLSALIRDELTAPWTPCFDLNVAPGNDYAAGRRDFHLLQCIQTPAQARVRMAYFLSQVCVVSDEHLDLHGKTRIPVRYWDMLMGHALGNYRDLLVDVTFSAGQLFYLTLLDSRKPGASGVAPDENYAREVMQLFSVGKDEIDANGRPTGRDVYTREDVSEAARVLTGMVMPLYSKDGTLVHNRNSDYYRKQRLESNQAAVAPDGARPYVYHEHHDFGEATILGQTIASDEARYATIRAEGADERYDANPATPDEKIVEAMSLARTRVEALIDILAEHPNTPRHLARQMIGHHVTRSYSPAYFRRVVQAAQDGAYTLPDGSVIGTGRRLDLAAIYAAVRLDPEARADASGKDRLWGRHRPAFLSYCAAIRPLLAAGEVAPVSAVPQMRDLSGIGSTSAWADKSRTAPLMAPSVFSFFDATFTASEDEFQGGHVLTPELQIVDTQSVTNFADQLGRVATCMTPSALRNVRTGSAVSYAAAVWSLDLARFVDAADDPGALTALLDLEFLGAAMETGNRDLVRQVIEGVEASPGGITDEQRFARFRAGWIATCCTPEFHVQR